MFFYLITAGWVSGILLTTFWQDSTAIITDHTNWIVIAIAGAFWPVVLPLSATELWYKKTLRSHQKKTGEQAFDTFR